MNDKLVHYTAIKALNALQNAKPRDSSSDSIQYHAEAMEDLKHLIKTCNKEQPAQHTLENKMRWAL